MENIKDKEENYIHYQNFLNVFGVAQAQGFYNLKSPLFLISAFWYC